MHENEARHDTEVQGENDSQETERKHRDSRFAEARDVGTNDGRMAARDRIADASNGGGDGFARCCWLQRLPASLAR